ncbi:MAG: DUF308 domain-containing protein [Candidatus Micrarchaeota archaeon]
MAKKTKNTNKNTNSGMGKMEGWFLGMGILFIILGVMFMLLPVIASVAAEMLFGLILLVLGIAEIVFSFMTKKWTGFLFVLLSGLLFFIVGIYLLTNPIAGMITLTLLIGILLFIGGFVKIIQSLSSKPAGHWEWLFFNGILSMLLGLLIIMAWPSDSIWVVGLLFGIDLLFGGITFVLLSRATKQFRLD